MQKRKRIVLLSAVLVAVVASFPGTEAFAGCDPNVCATVTVNGILCQVSVVPDSFGKFPHVVDNGNDTADVEFTYEILQKNVNASTLSYLELKIDNNVDLGEYLGSGRYTNLETSMYRTTAGNPRLPAFDNQYWLYLPTTGDVGANDKYNSLLKWTPLPNYASFRVSVKFKNQINTVTTDPDNLKDMYFKSKAGDGKFGSILGPVVPPPITKGCDTIITDTCARICLTDSIPNAMWYQNTTCTGQGTPLTVFDSSNPGDPKMIFCVPCGVLGTPSCTPNLALNPTAFPYPNVAPTRICDELNFMTGSSNLVETTGSVTRCPIVNGKFVCVP